MAGELIKIGVELDSSGVLRGVSDARRAFDQLTASALTTRQKFAAIKMSMFDLAQHLRAGTINIQQFHQGMAALRGSMVAVANAATNSGIGLERISRRLPGVAFGVANLIGGGVSGLRGLASSLIFLAPGSLPVLGAVAGFSAIVAALDHVEDSADRANRSITDMLRVARGLGSGLRGRREALLTELQGRTRTITEGSQQTGFETRTVTELPSAERRAEIMEELRVLRTAQAAMGRFGFDDAPSGGGGGKTARQRRDVGRRRFAGFPGGAPTKEDIQTLDLTAKGMNKIETDADRAARSVWDLGKSFDGLKDVSLPLVDGLAAGFGEMIDALGSGGNAGKAFFGGLMRELARYAKAQAVIELAHGFSALILKPQAAAAHFKAAALFGAGAALAGAAGGGGGGGGSGGAFGRGPLDRARDGDRQVVIVQIVGQRPGEVISQTVTGINREQNLGGGNLRTQVVRVPVEGVMVARV